MNSKPLKITHEDYRYIHLCLSVGIAKCFIAKYTWNISTDLLTSRLRNYEKRFVPKKYRFF